MPMQEKTRMAGYISRYGTSRSFTKIPTSGRLMTSSMRFPTHMLAIIPQKSVGFFVITSGPGTMPWMVHRADHQRHDRVGRDAEREERDERALRARVVRRFRPGHALDGAPAEAARVLRQLLLQRVGGEGPQHRAVAGQDAERGAEQGPAPDGAGGVLQIFAAWEEPS